MFIVVSGEDTYRALEKARELEAAYRKKYDEAGQSIERLPSAPDGVERLLAACTGGSLFSSRRFIRIDKLVTSCPKAKRAGVLRALANDPESTIVVTFEEGVLTKKDLAGFSDLPKFFSYDHPPLGQGEFRAWASAYATEHGVTDTAVIAALTERANGDPWYFASECIKVRAGGELESGREAAPSAYDAIDAFISRDPSRFTIERRFDDAGGILAQVPNQVRALALVSSGHRDGIHPFVAQKLSRMRMTNSEERTASLLSAFVWSRTGIASAEESLDILG